MKTPNYYRDDQAGEIYLERGAMVAAAAAEARARGDIRAAAHDEFRIAAFGIDAQIGFCHPEASLFVPGAVGDLQRALGWLYRNMEHITGLHFSMDTHRVFQIFHPAWWRDENGTPPAPFTPITHADVRAGKYTPISHPHEALEYTKRLEAEGKYVLTIWPYHTLLGGVSHALAPALMEAAIFHAVARDRQTHFETKGTHALTENYSVLSPEVQELSGKPVGTFNAPFYRMLLEYDRVYVFGQAKSHCVLSTLADIQKQISQTEPKLADKIWILEDAMSPVSAPPIDPLPPELDFPRVAEAAFEKFRDAGMHLVKCADQVVPV